MQSDEATRDLIEQWQSLMAANPEAAARATKQLEALREERDGLRAEVQRLTEKNKKLIKFSTDGVVALHAVTAERNSLREVLKPDRPTPKQYTQHPPELDWLPAAGNHPDLGLLVTERDALSAMAYRDAQIDKLQAEVQRLTEENERLRDDYEKLTNATAEATYKIYLERQTTKEEIELLTEERDALRSSLDRLEKANDAVCRLRSREQYLRMIDSGQQDALFELDSARDEARHLLEAQPGDGPMGESNA